MEQMFCGMLEDLPEGKPLEMAIHPKRARVLPAAVVKNPSYVECGASSGASTPNTTPPVNRDRHWSKIRSPLLDDEKSALFNYGSEEESGEEEEGVTQSVMVARVARMFVDEADEEVENGCININLEWPPRPSVCDPTPPSPSPPSQLPASPSPASPTPNLEVSMEPSEKFKFDWRAFSMPQINPYLRREPFSQNVGPAVSFTNPYEAFTAIWDREIIEVIVRETNIYAQQLTTIMLANGTICPNSRITRWQDTNVNEVYTYFAIVLAMGVVVKSRLEEYWNTSKDIFRTPGFSTEMTIDRYQLLSKCLHFNNNSNCHPKLLTRPQAKLYKIQPILVHLNTKFSRLYNLSQNVALDESLTMWKGWLDINQFIRNKAATVGIKTYELCESQTGYLWRFEVHAGHDTSGVQEDDPVSGIVPALVLKLLNGLEHRGHTIWMDNFYNSPALARELKVRGFDCVGTLRTNRQFVPSELASITKKDMTVGQVFGCTSGDVDLMLWRDKNLVAFVSTYHGLATTRCGDTLKPTVVQDYNICMGGVDRKDQQLAMYPIERKRTRVWYKKFFRKLLNVSVLNSYILLNKNRTLTHRKFRKALVTDLLAAHKPPAPKAPIPAAVHSPAQYDFIKPGKPDRLKRQCAVCKKRTVTYCKVCNVPMCVFTCYEPYHTRLK
ncbi:piggyBac transposable element-derived protein 4 isoform X2 [Papilio machaon]|uniref:piggyBac transposable element-derived protein 4 isoform X2 n=1 Tax=Papilio machaon TaxID=76193 RepID=UPI001E662C19|nr:piggyBac transposable element-derived protein 4 isoform X2 [Papilio machaon]